MLTVLLCALFFWMIWKMLVLGIRAAWGLTRLLCREYESFSVKTE